MVIRKGPVSLEEVQGRIRLRWRHNGKRRAISAGDASNPLGVLRAEQVAIEIAIDLGVDSPTRPVYDPTGLKYRKMLRPHAEESLLGVLDLFDKYYAYKLPGLERNSRTKYVALQKHLLPFSRKKAVHLDEQICRTFLADLSVAPETQRSYLAILRSCWNYGQARLGLRNNPWALIELPKVGTVPEPDPFDEAEVARILTEFEGSHYHLYVCGVLSLGCRLGEAAALTWGDIDFARGQASITKAWDGKAIKSTKNRRSRKVPIPQGFVPVLASFQKEALDLVFPAVEGGYIDSKNFLRRQWRPALERAGVRYRPTNKCRHTVWSHAVLTMPIAEAARAAGNLPSTLIRNYVGVVTSSPMPDLIQSQMPKPSSSELIE
jgi:integrase